MKRFAKGKAGWFAIHVGFIYLFIAIIALICYPLMLTFEVPIIFIPTTIYGWIMLLLFLLSRAIVPFADFIYIFLLIVDKINNNKNVQKLSFFKIISLISFLLITFLSVIILLSSCVQNFITKDRKILLKPQIMSVNYEDNYLNLKYDLPEFANSKNFTNKRNDPIFIKLKTNVRKMATAKEQTRKEPAHGLYLRGWTDYCDIYEDTLIREGEYAQVMIRDCKTYCEFKKCILKCKSKPRLARPDDECMAIQYRGLERYYVKQNENIEQLKEDIENGALIEATVSNEGFVHELKLIH